MAKGGDPSPVQPLYVGGNAYCGVPVAEQERDVVHIDAPLTIAENPNGTPILFDTDIAGERRNRTVAPGPFAQLHPGTNRFVIGRRAR